MQVTVRAVIQGGRIEALEPIALPEGAQVIVLAIGDADRAFWHGASKEALDKIWDNPEDDVYAQLLEE